MSSRTAIVAATVLCFAAIAAAGDPPRPTASATPSPAYIKLREALASPFNLTVDECTLPEFADQLRRNYKVPVILDKAAIDEQKNGDERPTKIRCDFSGLRLKTALDCALNPQELTWTVRDDALVITSNERAEITFETWLYDVTDLIEPGSSMDDVIELVTGMVAPTTWSEVGGAGAIKSFHIGDVEILVVSQTGRIQVEIAELLDSLQALRDAHGHSHAGVSPTAPRQFPPELTVEPSVQCDAIVKANTRFALDLYGKLRDSQGNLLVSPHGISASVAMLYAGAGGDTAKEMAKVMHWQMPPTEVNAGFRALRSAFQQVDADHRAVLHVASRLWGQPGIQFHAPYLKLLREDYGADAEAIDFVHSDAAKIVNAWVNEQTSGTIQRLISQPIPPDTALLLGNAVYFHAPWEQAFPAGGPSLPFDVGDKQVTVPFMTRTGRHLFAEVQGVQILEKPYHGGTLSMAMILPPKASGALDALERSLTPERLGTWLGAVRMQQVKVFVPKFKFVNGTRMANTLQLLGMRRAFSPDDADFSGIAPPSPPIFLNWILHEAAIEVDEQGTTAAAATVMSGGMGKASRAPKVPVFLADRPFLFLIRDRRTGAILFLGRLSNPQTIPPGPPERLGQPASGAEK